MYFAASGKSNTRETVAIALKTAEERGIRNIVVASVTGETARHFEEFDGNVVCVTHADGFAENGKNEMEDATRAHLQSKGMRVLTTSHVLSGVERGISALFHGAYPAEIMSHTLRMFGQGMKVCVEVGIMALEAGLVPYGENIIALGGTREGADTAVIMIPAYAKEVFRVRVNEILCKPF